MAEPSGIIAACTSYLESYLDGDAERMASCLHPALVKRCAVNPGDEDLALEETDFDEMTGVAVAGGPKAIGRTSEITILDALDDIATAKVLSEPFVDLVNLARFGDRWLIVDALYQRRPGADATGDPGPVTDAINGYAASWFDADRSLAASVVHPHLAERRTRPSPGNPLALEATTFEELLEIATDGPDEPLPRAWTAEVLDRSGDIAVGKVVMAWFDLYPLLVRAGERWMIVNILYRSRWTAA